MFRNPSNPSNNPVPPPSPQADPLTGEIKPNGQIINMYPKPNMAAARKLSDQAGENDKLPPIFNLKDHPEFDGVELAIVHVQKTAGDFGDYVIITGFPIDEYGETGSPMAVSTGSENVMGRALMIKDAVSIETPVIAKLRAGGRAWFLD